MRDREEKKNIYDQLSLFQEMICHAQGISMWFFEPDGSLRSGNCPDEQAFLTFLRAGNCLKFALEDVRDRTVPALLRDPIGLVYAADYVMDQGKLEALALIGPVRAPGSTLFGIQETMLRLEAPLSAKRSIQKRLETIPSAEPKELEHLGSMLHFLLTGESVKGKFAEQTCAVGVAYDRYRRWQMSEEAAIGQKKKGHRENGEEKRIVRSIEERLLLAVETGDMQFDFERYAHPPGKKQTYSLHAKIRPDKNTLIIFNALCSRAAIQGGVSEEKAADMEVYYMNQIEKAQTIPQLLQLRKTLFYDYTGQVERRKKRPEVSETVRDCCEYVQRNLLSGVSLAEAAASVGYTDYYLSRKFKRELGIPFHDYVNRLRVDLAKTWLRATDKPIWQISDELGFSTRNYFSRVFAGFTGVSPAVYRMRGQNSKGEEKTLCQD